MHPPNIISLVTVLKGILKIIGLVILHIKMINEIIKDERNIEKS